MKTTYLKKMFVMFAMIFISVHINAQTNVLICGAPSTASWNTDVQTKLQATGFFSSVQVFNTGTGTPSLATLQGYQAVLVFTDMGAQDPTTLGNNLAAYINGGGGVVNCVFANASVPLGGNFNTSTYQVIVPAGQTQNTPLTLGTILDPCHPIIQGVTNLSGGSSSYISTSTTLAPGAQTIANWSNGSWLAAYKLNVGPANARRADLNMYPPSSDARSDFWTSSTQGALLMGNALLYVAGVTNPVGLPAQPAAVSGAASICEGATGTYSIPTVVGATSYTWSVPGGTVINSGQGTTSINITAGTTSGTISVTANNACGSSTPRTFTLTINPLPVVTITGNSTICDGGTTTLTASGGGTYAWNTGATSASISPTLNFSSLFSCTVTSVAGCSASSNITVNVNALPNVTASAASSSVCDGIADTLMAAGANTYVWSSGGTTDTEIVAPNTTTTYTVTGTDNNGCVNTATVTVNVNALPTVTASATLSTICDGSSDTLIAAGAVSYAWNSGGTAAVEIVTPNITTTYAVVGTDANGCVNSATVTVVVNPVPSVTLGADITQCGGSATLDAQNAGSSYVWSDNSTNQTLVVSTSGTYVVVVTDANGCEGSDTINVTVNSNPNVSLGADITQCGGLIILDAQNAGAAYVWSDNSTNQTLVVSASGTYFVDVTDANGCEGSDTITVTINTPPTVTGTASPSTVCLDDANVTLTGAPAGGTWSGPGVTGNSFDPSVGIGTQTLTYSYIDANGCLGSADVTVSVNACVGVAENTLASGVNVYPNPNNGVFTLAINANVGDVVIEMVDMQGRVVYAANENNVQAGFTKQISLETQASGLYIIRLTSATEQLTLRVNVQK